MRLYNSLTGKIEDFNTLSSGHVGMYACGMTVYDYAHIGHGRKYINDDILRRTLAYIGYEVKHVQNVTDVGHLVSDADSGEDKLEKGARKTGKTVWEVAEFYTKHFYDSMGKLNILKPNVVAKATDHIPEQIELIQKLFDKGYAYDTPEAVYFDISKFEGYGELFGRQALDDKQTAVRAEVHEDENKKHPADFALWFKRVGRFSEHAMHWDSPWGNGFPGWHIECSAMSMKYLGEQIDIHTGGEDHIAVHHPNEIAQSEAATGKHPFVGYWVHTTFLTVDGTKMSKSLGNFYTIEDIVQKGYDPLALRYLFLTAHYRKRINFTWEALAAAENALERLRGYVDMYKGAVMPSSESQSYALIKQKVVSYLEDDLKTPQALAEVWEAVKSDMPDGEKYQLLCDLDNIFGLGLADSKKESIDPEVNKLLAKREELRKEGKYAESDTIRDLLEKEYHYKVQDK